jgi:hypothetical protein
MKRTNLYISAVVSVVMLLLFMDNCQAMIKCARLAYDRQASYSFSSFNGCTIRTADGTWMLSRGYLRRYQYIP